MKRRRVGAAVLALFMVGLSLGAYHHFLSPDTQGSEAPMAESPEDIGETPSSGPVSWPVSVPSTTPVSVDVSAFLVIFLASIFLGIGLGAGIGFLIARRGIVGGMGPLRIKKPPKPSLAEEVLDYIKRKRRFTIPELAETTGAPESKVWRTVKKLIKRKLVKPTGEGGPARVYEYLGY